MKNRKRWMALFAILLMAVCAPCSAEWTSEDLKDLEAPLAGLMALQLETGLPYPAPGQEISNEYALGYLFYMANIFAVCDAVTLPDAQGSFERYAPFARDEIELLLKWAFGDLFTVADLEPDGEAMLVSEGAYYVGVADGYVISAVYAGEEKPAWSEDARFPYDFSLTYADGGSLSGRIEATVDMLEDADAPLCVTGFAPVQSGDTVTGNWRAPDGYWCSLMEEGLIFCFDDAYQVIAEGEYALEGESITVTLGGESQTGTLKDTFALRLNGVARTYQREG